MQSCAMLPDVNRDSTVGIGSFQEFQVGVTNGHKTATDADIFADDDRAGLQAEQPAIKLDAGIQVLHRDP